MIYRVGNSKEPSIDQIRRMSYNLQAKYGESAYISVNVWSHSHLQASTLDKARITFELYLEHFRVSDKFRAWPDLIKRYRQLMKEATNA